MTDITKLPVRNKRENAEGLSLVPPPPQKCQHLDGPFEVDEKGGRCKCLDCGEDVSPIFVLVQLMKKESRWRRTRERYEDEMKRLAERSKTKCEHCGKITRISRR